ncbi:MAG: aminotransferase class III-fold pyridoxal phosphate-dependent enzyme [Gemmatimonadetes bacterium]|nr:aminotransferase class III-fold pyridoxal phosphate-dependent enzyme [Gemmatimonadota bacterium]
MDTSEFSGRHTYGTWRKQAGFRPLHIVAAEGCRFTDASGKSYLDFSSQLICSNLGHKNQAVIDAICEQAKRLPYVTPGFTTDARIEATRALLEVVPKGIEKFFYSTSGTEANEAAVKIARLYTGKHKIISRYKSYHGATAAAISMTGDPRRWLVEPAGTLHGVVFGPDCDCYRCPLGREPTSCGIACADYVDYMIKHEGNVAAVIVEPIVGTNGVLVPTDDYLPKLREITRKHGVLLIIDEVMSGWGRTGAWFACQHWGIEPDILTTAKGVTAAYAPLGVTGTTRAIADYFEEHMFAHGHTYEAHPLVLAPVAAAIREYKRLDLIERAKAMGEKLGEKLRGLAMRHPSVGDVRGKGLFWALDFTRDRATREPLNTVGDKMAGKPIVVDAVTRDLLSRGVYVMGWINHLIIAPPLIVTEAELDEGVAALDAALGIADAEVRNVSGQAVRAASAAPAGR